MYERSPKGFKPSPSTDHAISRSQLIVRKMVFRSVLVGLLGSVAGCGGCKSNSGPARWSEARAETPQRNQP
jgi:hypothetical protein